MSSRPHSPPRLLTLSDKRSGYGDNLGNFTAWQPNVWTVSDYYPFGMQMEERRLGVSGRFGYNGKEMDNEMKGEGNSLDFGARMYDSRVARFLSLDPDRIKYPYQSPYVYADNTPIQSVDEEGKGVLYASLKLAAQTSKSTIGINTSGSVSFGVGVSASLGMAVDYMGNAAFFYSSSATLDRTIFNIDKIGFGANINITGSIMPGRNVSDLSGAGFNVGASFYSPKLLGGGLSLDFSISDRNEISFLGLTATVGIGTPGFSTGGGNNITNAVLFAENDYKVLIDTKWDEKGLKTSMKWEQASNDNMRNPSGFWNYTGKEISFLPVEGEKDTYSVNVKLNYYYTTSGKGAAEGRRNVGTSETFETGIKMRRTNRNTYQSDNLKTPTK